MKKQKITQPKIIKNGNAYFIESTEMFAPFYRLKQNYIKAENKVKFLTEYREYLGQSNEVFIANYDFLMSRLEVVQ